MVKRLTFLYIIGLIFSFFPNDLSAAEPSQKFALLVGVGDYKDKFNIQLVEDLSGPANDVGSIRSLLTEDFGFSDKDIVELVDENATRTRIEEAFKSHLIANAEANPNAIVLFYFSGHGSQVPDTNGDEGDGMDETLLPYERGVDENAYIKDDTLGVWIEQLSRYTENIVIIVDSCNSGTVARNTSTSRARWVPPSGQPSSSVAQNPNAGRGLLPRDRAYTLLTAAAPNQAAWEGEVPSSDNIHGYFTYYLVSELRQFPDLTYDQARRRASNAMKIHNQQDPQSEGDVNRRFLGGPTDRRPPSIAVEGATDEGFLRIATGSEIGLRRDALLSVFLEDTGNGEKPLGMAVVVDVAPGLSLARLLENTTETLGDGVRVRVVSPVSGLERKTVAFSDAAKTHPAKGSIAETLSQSGLIRLSAAGETANHVVRFGCPLQQEGERDGCEFHLYLARNKSFEPLYDIAVPFDSPSDEIAAELRRAAEMASRQENLRSLDSQGFERLPGLKLQIVLLDVMEIDGIERVIGRSTLKENGTLTVGIGQNFQFLVTNDSLERVYFAVLGIFNSGNNAVLVPEQTGTRLEAGSSVLTSLPLKANSPEGLDSYKLIATTTPGTNFRVLEQNGLPTGAKSNLSALSLLFDNVVSDLGARDADVSGVVSARWATDMIDILVIEE